MLRDVLCKRDVAIGGQSYALATAAGASVYVLLRQLVVRGWYLPLFSRILASFGVVLAERVSTTRAVHRRTLVGCPSTAFETTTSSLLRAFTRGPTLARPSTRPPPAIPTRSKNHLEWISSLAEPTPAQVYVWHEDATDRLLPPWPRAIVDACRDADDDGAVRRRPTPSDPL